ncbi:nucleoside transporter [bacterium]|nr:nucleoside transporter [candidate division CSSED10-310 bacterium]
MESYNWISFTGIFVFIFVAWCFSNHRRSINWRLVAWGIALQSAFAVIIFRIPPGSRFFLWLNGVVVSILQCASSGSQFLFNRLALPPGSENTMGETSLGFYFAFQGLPSIVFFSALMALLYYFGTLPWLIRLFARVFSRLMRISGAEALCAASNIFVGIESALTIQPHIAAMTRSELCAILTCGMATVASNVLAVYVFSLQDVFPTIAAHLISASFLSAPAGLLMAKILYPEKETPVTLGKDVPIHYQKPESPFTAIIHGAETGINLILNIAGLLLAVLGLVALADLCLVSTGDRINSLFNCSIQWNLAALMGYLFYLPTLITGVPIADAWEIAKIIGERSIVTEVPAYQDLAILMARNGLTHPRSAVIATYALCGFAHIGSIAIFVGGVSALARDRTSDIARCGIRSLFAATLACMMTACIAGTFFSNSSLLIP